MAPINKWLFALLLAPLFVVQIMHDLTVGAMLMHVFISASLTILLNATQLKNKWLMRLIKTLLIGFYFAYLFMLLFEVVLFDFTGKGFTNEVYFHFELESLRIGFHEYPIQLLAFVMVVTIYLFTINSLLKKAIQPKNHLITLLAVFGLILGTSNSSIIRFTTGFMDYLWQESIDLDQGLIKQYIDLGVLQNEVITTKKHLRASATKNSKNLILLYLESFNEGLLHLEKYPNLTPNLNQLSQNYQNLDHISSSYVTIEGIISSQCGTMLPMTAGNNTFLTEGQLMSNMPCLGDVLNKAGYTQYYLGGAQMEFAGKGKFLETHGYDHVWGLEHWKANGLRETKGIWGLSDSQLFKNTIETIKTAALNPPYNMTLLTLGTHLPGYVYDECQPYVESDETFINAIHCTDQLVGQFVKELEKAQLLENAVLMIVADHGIFPSVKMKELFAAEVNERHLIGITNYQPLPDQQLSSYDLAPTLLDMLDVRHNATFLYGQSLFSNNKSHQKYPTRYADWQNKKMVLNPEGDCIDKEILTWPLNKCQKRMLLSLTSQILEHYSINDQLEPLSCELDINFIYTNVKNKKGKWTLRINDANHFEHFYHKGYLLKTLNYRAGTFIFLLNKQLAIEKHLFYENNDETESNLDKEVRGTNNPVLVVKSTLHAESSDVGEKMALEIEFYNKGEKMWSKKTIEDKVGGVDICQ